MSVLPVYCVYRGLNRARNTSLYDLLIDLGTRVEWGGVGVRGDDLRPCDLRL